MKMAILSLERVMAIDWMLHVDRCKIAIMFYLTNNEKAKHLKVGLEPKEGGWEYEERDFGMVGEQETVKGIIDAIRTRPSESDIYNLHREEVDVIFYFGDEEIRRTIEIYHYNSYHDYWNRYIEDYEQGTSGSKWSNIARTCEGFASDVGALFHVIYDKAKGYYEYVDGRKIPFFDAEAFSELGTWLQFATEVRNKGDKVVFYDSEGHRSEFDTSKVDQFPSGFEKAFISFYFSKSKFWGQLGVDDLILVWK